MSTKPELAPEQEQVGADTARVVGIAYAAGSLRTALEHHINWLETLSAQIAKPKVHRRELIERETAMLREILADADAWIARE